MAQTPRSSPTVKVFILVFLAGAILAFFYFDLDRYLSLGSLKAHRDALLDYTQAHYGMAAVLFIVAYTLATGVSVPGATAMTLAGGFLFGSVLGTLYINLGATTGATLAFLASRYLLRDWVEHKFGQQLDAFQKGFAENAFHYLITLRLIPIFPFFLVNLLSGLTRVGIATYIAATAIGIIPGSFVYAYAGRELGTLNSIAEIATPRVLLAFTLLGVLALVPVIYRKLSSKKERRMNRSKTEQRVIPPDDAYNRALVNNVHPPTWNNPQPTEPYNLVVLGAGTAGLVTAAVATGLGAKVALIERELMGGDCLNVGCVPSKAIIRAARVCAEVRAAGELGLHIQDGFRCDFAAAMARMRKLRARISQTDAAERYRGLGVDVYLGEARFTGRDTVEVEGQRLTFKRAAICTGTRAAAPPIPGLEEAGYLTNETVFSLTTLPRRIAVIGGGPIGCELAQAFARLGSEVCVFEQRGRILPNEDADAAEIVQRQMATDGVCFVFDSKVARIERRGDEKLVHYEMNGKTNELAVDEILVGVGRAPNVEGLGLEQAGVEYDPKIGVKVNSRLQTTHARIYAAGDVCFPLKFTHLADAMAQIVIQNALFPHPFGLGYARTEALILPWCTYTEPEIAHVGLYEAEAEKKGFKVETYTHPLSEVDRAVLDGEEAGFARLHVRRGTDRILGATIVGAHAGEMISEVTALMQSGRGLKTLLATIHPYPTQAEVIKKAANQWRKAHFTAGMQRLLQKWFEWTR